jgi:FdhD protein
MGFRRRAGASVFDSEVQTFMNNFFVTKRIHRFFNNGKIEEIDDDIIGEFRLLIRIDNQDFIHAVCTPSQIKEFVVGFLRARGLIDSLEDIASFDINGNIASVTRTSRLRDFLPHLSVLESTGTKNVRAERFTLKKKMVSSGLRVPLTVLLKGMEELSRKPLYVRSGGTHCAILFSQDGNALVSAEDIGRHNAVDKTIGGGMIKDVDFPNTWLAVSGRLPEDMVLKPLSVGISLIASVSAPTSEGIALGERSGLTVVGFVRDGRLNCYCHPERII